MTSIYLQLRGEIAAFDKDFTERESSTAKRMVEETEALKMEGETRQYRNVGKVVKLEHNLLYDMLLWFSCHYRQEKPQILAAARVLQQHATWFVRNPTQYRVECAEASEKWEEYRSGPNNDRQWPGGGDDDNGGGDGGGGSTSGNEDDDSKGEHSPEEVVSYPFQCAIQLADMSGRISSTKQFFRVRARRPEAAFL